MEASPTDARWHWNAADFRSTIALAFAVAFAVVFAAVVAVGCASAPVSLKLAPELEGVVPKPVSGRSGNAVRDALTFDRWSAASTMHPDQDRFAAHGDVLPTGANDQLVVDSKGTAFEFELRSNGAPASITRAKCIERDRSATHTAYGERATDETTVTLPGYPRLDCEFAGARPGRLTVRPAFVTQRDSGSAQFGEQLWEIRSVNNVESQRTQIPLARFGYEVRIGGRVVAAVETFGAGRVWMDPKLPPQDADEVSVALTALLYYASLLDLDDT
jgi:hypothetical protein